jgi:hypothetical protein
MPLRLASMALKVVGPNRPWARGMLAYRVLAAVAEPRRTGPATLAGSRRLAPSPPRRS